MGRYVFITQTREINENVSTVLDLLERLRRRQLKEKINLKQISTQR